MVTHVGTCASSLPDDDALIEIYLTKAVQSHRAFEPTHSTGRSSFCL